MAGVLLLTRVVPGGPGLGPPPKIQTRLLRGEALALGVTQVLLGALQVALGGALLGALPDPLSAQLGVPLGTGTLFMVSGAVLAAAALSPSLGRVRAGLALGVLSAVGAALELALLGLLLPHGCHLCGAMGPGAQGAVLGVQALLLAATAAEVALAVGGAVAAGRALEARGEAPVVIYQTALPPPAAPAPPAEGAEPAEAPPPGPAPE